MKVFISWSGEESKAVALILRNWIRFVLQAVEPWMSEADLGAGKRWSDQIAGELQHSNFGIVCLTKENLASPWLMFEAGAIAKTLNDALVCPYLVRLRESDIPKNHPLTQFQTEYADEHGTRKLMLALNSNLENPLPVEMVSQSFAKFWPDFDSEFQAIPSHPMKETSTRSDDQVLEEVLSLVRDLHRRPQGRASVRDLGFSSSWEDLIEIFLNSVGVEEGIIWTRVSGPDTVGEWTWDLQGVFVFLRRLGHSEEMVRLTDQMMPRPLEHVQKDLRSAVYRLFDRRRGD